MSSLPAQLDAVETRWLVAEGGVSQLSNERPVDGAVAWVDIDLSAIPPAEHQAHLREILEGLNDNWNTGLDEELLEEAVEDLNNCDEWPEMRAMGPARKLSLTCLIPLDPNAEGSRHAQVINPPPPLLYASRVEIVLTVDWVVSAWHPIERITQSADQSAPIPDEINSLRNLMLAVVADTVETDELSTGGDLGIALIRGSLATFSGHRKDLHKRLDDWEHIYYEKHFGDDAEDEDQDTTKGARDSTRTLAEIHAAGVDLSRELDHLTAPRDRAAIHWVGKKTTSPEGTLAGEIYDQKIDRYRISLRDIRDRVRAGLDLSHSVESTARDAAARKRDSFIAKVAAVFLAPTLIAGFYGINTNYPDSGTTRGTVEAIVLMILSAVGAWRGIVWFENRDHPKHDD